MDCNGSRLQGSPCSTHLSFAGYGPQSFIGAYEIGRSCTCNGWLSQWSTLTLTHSLGSGSTPQAPLCSQADPPDVICNAFRTRRQVLNARNFDTKRKLSVFSLKW
jgi:hypothetical protein